jgi:ABC-2 type transport system permease protein
MNMQSNVMGEAAAAAPAMAPAVITPLQRFTWLVKREVWESRSIYIAPLAAAGLILFGFVVSLARMPEKIRAREALEALQQRELTQQPYIFAAGLVMAVTLMVAAVFCLDALYGERRDRSILFWKSMPVSDVETVLSKAAIPLLVLPVITVAATFITHVVMLLASTAVVAGNGLSVGMLWNQVALVPMTATLAFHLVGIHGLWFAPVYAWLLLVSAWARRMPFLWAALPPLGIAVVEKIAFNSSHFAGMLGRHFMGAPTGPDFSSRGMAMDPLGHVHLGDFLASPGLWIGLLLTAAFLAGAVRLRREHGPI